MRIRILSDLHREFGPASIPPVEADTDLIILAGDISTKLNALPWIREFSGQTPVVYICGNHEFYGDKLPHITEKLKEATQGSNIHVLENDHVTLHGWHIYGCTLWTDMALHGDHHTASAEAADWMNDYKRIRNSDRGFKKLTPGWTRQIHLRSVERMDTFLQAHDPARTIVVTHHGPSALSLPEHRRGRTISAAYASNLDSFILRHQPALWIHGHIHHPVDYRIGTTRVISNTQGYPDAPAEKFAADLVLDFQG